MSYLHSYVKEWARWLFCLFAVVLMVVIAPFLFIYFWVWELVDRKGSNAFWDEVYNPYEEGI